MSHFRCNCGHDIVDQTDFLPYKARILKDEDTEKPLDQLADILLQHLEERQQGREVEFLRQFWRSDGWTEKGAEFYAQKLAGKPLSTVFSNLMAPFWNNYQRIIYECEECGRLWVQTDKNGFVPYRPETDTRHVLWSHNHHSSHNPVDE